MAKIIYVVTEDWYFCSHRFDLALAVKNAGFDVIVATKAGHSGKKIEEAGFRLYAIPFSRSLKKPWSDLSTLILLMKLYIKEKPEIIHHVSLKPVILGSLAARICQSNCVINALTGLGYLFTDPSSGRTPLLRRIVQIALRWLLDGKNTWTIMQNPDDAELLINNEILNPDHLVAIRGSGVDVRKFKPSQEPDTQIKVILAGRLLRDKGVIEFVDAARILIGEDVKAEFILAGSLDKDNPTAIDEADVQQWEREGIVKWIGYQKDMATVFMNSHIVCLPSYREGLPKVLLEAASACRPIVATDVPGCREIVHHGENGYLVPIKDPIALAESIKRLINDQSLREQMGKKGREIVESNFTSEIVHEQTLALYKRILGNA